MKNQILKLTCCLALILLTTISSPAATVSQVKGTKVLLQLEGASLLPDTEIYISQSNGKKIGLAKIKVVKGDRAIAELLKGRAEPGANVSLKAGSNSGANSGSNLTGGRSSSTTPSSSPDEAHMNPIKSRPRNTAGFLTGITNNSMSLTAQYGSTKSAVELKDTGFVLKGFYDYKLTKDFLARLGLGLQTFSAKGTAGASVCDNGNTKACEISFMYAVAEAEAQYYLTDSNFRMWLGGGYHFMMAASKKNNISNLSSDTSTNQMISFGLGADWWISKSSFIPISFLYGIYPGSSNVNVSSLLLQVGYGFGF